MLLQLIFVFYFFNDTSSTYIYTLSLHDALPILLACASIVGGIIGKMVFNNLVNATNNLDTVSLIQSIILTILMLAIFIYYKNKNSIPSFNLNNIVFIFLIGLVLGMIAAFLGVGGGPFNVAILALGFSMSAKDTSVNSLFIIFFSQMASLITTQVTTGFEPFNLELLPFIVAGGIIGGLIGSFLLSKVKNKHVENIFSVGVMIILLLNFFNVITFLL